VVRTGIGKTTLCLGGEVDASTISLLPISRKPLFLLTQPSVWDSKPQEKGSPINWVELKTSAEIRGPGDLEAFHRKLMKYWIQSFLLGVPKIIVGFRTRDGVLVDVQEIETHSIPETVNSGPNPSWNADMCVNFAAVFLDCKLHYLGQTFSSVLLNQMTGLRETINDEGVWRIRRQRQSPIIEVVKVEETGHGDLLSEEFKNWRIKLALQQ
jgi:RAT1-interacting protein